MRNFKRFLFGGTALARVRFERVDLKKPTYAPNFGWRPA